jgi:hypothetical protein
MQKYIDLAALGRVLAASLIAGVGLVSAFGLGLVGLSEHRGQMQEGSHAGRRGGSPAWLAVAIGCFAIVVVGVGLGIYAIIG